MRELTGKTHIRGEKLAPGELHLVVHVCIFNENGQLLIQKRQKDKEGWPNYWDLSAAGSALKGETLMIIGLLRKTWNCPFCH
ncbi:Uncharacterized Nudix hydrolase lmo0368 [Listeria monocytogenes N53-1]|nr:Uncharacterized Nudix hydrolase lmo0368 [Listeria monocytogenes]CCQ22821.1 Uncharacterized Nudix hydrolase lmo0368 [Listeria monocytogenes N53-1]